MAKSQDLTAAWTLLAALIGLTVLGPQALEDMVDATRHYFTYAPSLLVEPGTLQSLTVDAVVRLAGMLMPLLAVLLAAGVAANLVQVGFLFAPEAIMPKVEKLNPFSGLGKFFSIRSAAELVKSVLKLVVIGYIVYVTLRSRWEQLLVLSSLTPIGIVTELAALTYLVWLRIVIAMLVIGILDYGFQRWRYEVDLRMTAQEAKEEMKQFEGDPRIRQRIRAIQRQTAMRRMMKEVPAADVVVTNPVRFAVALRYDMAQMDAPIVVAKGARLIAQRIRDLALENDVPIVQKPELARTLFRTVEVGNAVPEDLFRAVAEVLAYVYEIDRRAEKVRERSAVMADSGGTKLRVGQRRPRAPVPPRPRLGGSPA